MSNDVFLIINQYTFTMTSAGRQIWHVAEGNIPLLTSTGTTYDNPIGNADFNLPVIAIASAGSNIAINALPAVTISAVGSVEVVGYLDETLLAIEVTSESSVWSNATFDLVMLESTGESGAMANFDVSPFVSTGTGHSNEVAYFDIDIPVITLSASAIVGAYGITDKSIANPTMTATGYCSISSSLAVDTPDITLSATGITGLSGTLNAKLSALTITSNGLAQLIGNVSVTLPAIEITASSYVVPVGNGSMTLPVFEFNYAGGLAGRFDSYVLRYIRP